MKKIRVFTLAVVLLLALCACGKEDAAAPATAPAAAPVETMPLTPLSLTQWDMSATTWSSPNGATINITATPNRYTEGQKADFIVRLEGEEAANLPCQWDGKSYTASADLNAQNGYCYYIVLTDTNGTVNEVSVNTPSDPRFEALINMEDSLNSYCNLTVEDVTVTDGALTLNTGLVEVQTPKIGNDGQTITCVDVLLILSLDGEKIDKEVLVMQGTDDVGYYTRELSGITFPLPQMEGDHQLSVELEVKLSNDQILTAPGGSWYNQDEGLMSAFG